jgi:sRNA-binding protein
VPLKVGIYADLKAADRDWRWQDLTAIISAYVSDLRYLRVLTAGAPRVGLKPSPRILRVPH